MKTRLLSKWPKTKAFSIAILIVLSAPLLYYWIYCIWINPSQNYYTNDAEFPYFLNSLAVFKGGTYTYIDHPGTPVEEIGTLILGLTYPFLAGRPEGFIPFQLQNPDVFLNIAYGFLIFFNLLCILIFFWIALRALHGNQTVAAAALALMYFAIHPSALSTTNIWNHNSFNFPFGTLLLLFFFHGLNQESFQGELDGKILVGFGFPAGILASVTIYMAAWIPGILAGILVFYRLQRLAWRRTVRALAIASLASLAGFVIASAPIFDRLIRFWNWIDSILTHQSRYLAVPKDESTLARLGKNLLGFYDILPILLVATLSVIALALVAFFLWRKRLAEKPGLWAVTAGLSLQILALTVVFLDRPLREAYFLSLAASLPVLTMAVLAIWEYSPLGGRVINAAFSLLVIIGVVSTAAQSVAAKRDEAVAFRASQARTAEVIANYARQTGRAPQDLLIFWMYGTHSKCWGLRQGDTFSRNIFRQEIDQICHNQYYLESNLRADMYGNSVRLKDTNWDVIFTCGKSVQDLAEIEPSVAVQEYPEIKWNCGGMVAVLNQGR